MKAKLAALGAALGFMAGALPMLAHHSFSAEYDTAKRVTMTGKFVKMEWINPHSALYFTVTDPATGKEVDWRAETPPPNAMVRAGVRPSMLHVGDVITLSGNLAKDGSNLMWCGSVTFPNGTVIGLQGGMPGEKDVIPETGGEAARRILNRASPTRGAGVSRVRARSHISMKFK